MCYSTYISTDSPENLGKYNSGLILLKRVPDAKVEPCAVLLDHPNKWHVGSKSICSCTFRHLTSVELGFSEPVYWYEEGQDEIEATREMYSILVKLLSSGYQVDLIDAWHDTLPQDIKTLYVSLDEVSDTAFRLFENHKFILTKKAAGQIHP